LKNGSILIISNNSDVSQQISSKIKLLRECDTINNASFLEAISVLNCTCPSIIILYWQKTDAIGIVKEIRSIKALDKVPIIFVMDTLNEDILFNAFDCGIDEFFTLDEPDSVMLMRIFLMIQKAVLYSKIDTNIEIMQETNIIDKKSGIYSSEFSSLVMNHFFNKCLENNLENTVFMYFKPIQIDKKFINMNRVANIIKSIPRSSDIVSYAPNSGFYFILYNGGAIGAKSVTQRIKKSLTDICEVYVNAAEITTTFDEIEPILSKVIYEQISAKNDFNFFYSSNIKDSLVEMENTKIKQETEEEKSERVYSTLEKIAIPVFYHLQTVYSELYPEASIKYDLKNELSTFSISQGSVFSKVVITYPEYSKYIFDIMQNNLSNEPVIKRITCNVDELDDKFLTKTIKDFISEFAAILSHSQIGAAEENGTKE